MKEKSNIYTVVVVCFKSESTSMKKNDDLKSIVAKDIVKISSNEKSEKMFVVVT